MGAEMNKKNTAFCIQCCGKSFIKIPNAVIQQHYKGVRLFVTTPGIVCDNCGHLTVDRNQIDMLVKHTKQAYKESLQSKT